MKRRTPPLLPLLGIVIVASACDNVAWGGVDFHLQGPKDHSAPAADTAAEVQVDESVSPLPEGPILLAGRRRGNEVELSALAVQVGPVWQPLVPEGGDASILDRYVAERLTPGSRYTLFSEGVRIGTFVQLSQASIEDVGCSARPVLSGAMEVLPEAASVQTVIAIPEDMGGQRAYGDFRRRASTYEQRVGSLNTAQAIIPLVGAPWPGSVLEIRKELNIVSLDGGGTPGLAASFIYQDELRVGAASDAAYGIFFTARPLPGDAFEADYIWYRRAGEGGKAWPHLYGQIDLDNDGKDELLLEVMGENSRWFQLEGFRGGAWRTLFADACAEAPGSAWQAGGTSRP